MTPLIEIDDIYFKREDQNITGSAKDRAISLQVQNLIENYYSKAVISSTGNAAISAQYFCNKLNIPLKIFVSPKTNPEKLKLLKNYTTSLKPISDAFKYAKLNHAYLLRQSTDPVAQVGYSQIATEILEQLPQTTSIFVPVGSGTTLLGITSVFPNTYAVQEASNCPIASHFDNNFKNENITLCDSLGVKLLPLKIQIFQKIKHGAVIQNQQIVDAMNFLKLHDIITSPEGALALAAYYKFKDTAGNYPVIILSGAKR